MPKVAKVCITSSHMHRLLLGKDISIPLNPDVSEVVLTMEKGSQLGGLMGVIGKMEKLGQKLGAGAHNFITGLIDDLLEEDEKDKDNHGTQSKNQGHPRRTRCRK